MKFNSYKPLRLIELFCGIGAQAKALTNLGIKYEHWLACDFDKYAIQSYNAVHGTNFNPSDITKLTASDLNITDTDHYNYLLTYSFPCQSLSNAGKGEGMAKGSGTSSGLLWEVERLLNECTELPQVLLMENVPQVHGKKHINDFNKWIDFLESKGYSNYWKDLNAKDYGIPQKRNRCFMVSILERDCSSVYGFPKPIDLTLTLGDLLEKEVDEKYYLSNEALDKMTNWKSFQNPLDKVLGCESVSPTITTRIAISDGGGINASTKLYSHKLTNEQSLRTGYHDLDIRYYTPRDCWLLMGFGVEDYLKAKQAIYKLPLTDNQKDGCLYKQAGNSIVVNVLMAIFKELFVPKQTRSEWLDELLGGV